MYISSDKLFLICCGLALALSSLLTNLYTSLFNIPYLYLFAFIAILGILLQGILLLLVRNREWYKKLTDYPYYKFNQVYKLYQTEVIKNKKAYRRFVDDYYSENQTISFSTDSQGKPIIAEYNLKNKTINQILDILNNRSDLVNKFFITENFKYPNFLSLIKEYNTTVIDEKPLESIIDSSKQSVQEINLKEKLSKIKDEILAYEQGNKKPKHYGHRMFGYLLREEYFTANNDNSRIEKWQEFTGLETIPEMDYLRNPDSNKNSTDKIDKQLEEIAHIFYLVGLEITVSYHNKKSSN